jgi:hypothetical protein
MESENFAFFENEYQKMPDSDFLRSVPGMVPEGHTPPIFPDHVSRSDRQPAVSTVEQKK